MKFKKQKRVQNAVDSESYKMVPSKKNHSPYPNHDKIKLIKLEVRFNSIFYCVTLLREETKTLAEIHFLFQVLFMLTLMYNLLLHPIRADIHY